MSARSCLTVVLAAGEGTRMRSTTPKVLHPLCGRPMILHVLDRLVELPLARIVLIALQTGARFQNQPEAVDSR